MDGGASVSATLEMNSFPVQIVISNITTLGEQQITLSTWTNIKASYTITIRDSLLESNCNGHGDGIQIRCSSFSANQKIQINNVNCTLAGHRIGIAIYVYSQHKNKHTVVTHAAPEIEIKRTLVTDNRVVGLKVSCGGFNYSQPSILLINVLFSSTVNRRLSAILPSVVYMEFAQNVSFIDCNFTRSRGTPIVAISSRFSVSGTLIFVNNTGFEGGALAFYDDSSMRIHNNTEILFAGNCAQRVGGAIFVKSCSNFEGSYGKNLCSFNFQMSG